MRKTFKEAMNEELNALREVRRDREITVWDLFLSLVKGKEPRYILALKADFSILEMLARGMSPSFIAGKLGIGTSEVVEVANLWGFKPLNVTLDFNPFYVYKDDMSADALMAEINEILAIPITLDTAQKVVYNIKQYNIVKLFLEDIDD